MDVDDVIDSHGPYDLDAVKKVEKVEFFVLKNRESPQKLEIVGSLGPKVFHLHHSTEYVSESECPICAAFEAKQSHPVEQEVPVVLDPFKGTRFILDEDNVLA